MLNVTTEYSNVLAAKQSQPGYLVEIVFPDAAVLRLSSFGDVTWDARSWVNARVSISGISSNGSASTTGQLGLGILADDPNLIMGYALNATKGFTGSSIKVWVFDRGLVNEVNELALENAIPIFQGLGDNVTINELEVLVSLASVSIKYQYAPRVKINKVNGFNFIQPKGTKIPWGSEVFILE